MTLFYSALASLSSICRSTVILCSLSLCIILSYAIRRCVSFLALKGAASIRFASQWYAVIMYWFLLRAWMGKRPVSSVYNLLIGVTWIKISSDRTWVIGSSGELVGSGLALVELAPWRFWAIFPMMVALGGGQYLVVLASVSPVHND